MGYLEIVKYPKPLQALFENHKYATIYLNCDDSLLVRESRVIEEIIKSLVGKVILY